MSSRAVRIVVLSLLTLLAIYIAIIALHIADKSNSHEFLYFSEAAVGLALVVVFILLMNRASFVQLMADKDKTALNDAPFGYALYDLRNATLSISDKLCAELKLNTSNKTQSFFSIFDPEDLKDIQSKIDSYTLIESFNKDGFLRITNNDSKTFFNFWCKLIKDQLGNKHIVFWFYNVTSEVVDKTTLLKTLQSHRFNDFQNLAMLDMLPFPIWHKDSERQIIFKNKALLRMMKDFHFDPNTIDIHESYSSRSSPLDIVKKFLLDTAIYTYRFHELPTNFEDNTLGFGLNITDLETAQYKLKSLENILTKLIDNLTVGFLILDAEQRVINYNTSFQNIFNLESKILSKHPHYRYILDVLRENNQFPELKGYREKHLQIIRSVRDYTTDLLHLPDGKTIKLTVIPSTENNTILIYENITPSLEIERELYDAKLITNSVLNLLPAPVIIFDHQGKGVNYNHKFFDLFLKDTELEFATIIDLNFFNEIYPKNAYETTELLKRQFYACIEDKKCTPITILLNETKYTVTSHALYDHGVVLAFSEL